MSKRFPSPDSEIALRVPSFVHRCDSVSLDGKPVIGSQGSYTHAQKMWASMTHVFSRVLGIGSQHWQLNKAQDGTVMATGNPSISDRVSTYMVGLRRRKVSNCICISFLFTYTVDLQVKEGETTTSARAITHVSFLLSRVWRCVDVNLYIFF